MTAPRAHLVLPTAAALLVLGSLSAQQKNTEFSGFLTGMKGFKSFHEPLGQPLYFESPFNESNVRALFLRHEFANDSALMGGDLTVYAVQARLAINERLQFIATKDGYSDLNSGLVKDDGWNDIGIGLKYVAYADPTAAAIVSTGLRYTAENGDRKVLQGGVDEFSPFVSFGKGWDDLHLLGGACLRVPTNSSDGNVVGHWDLHLDYDVNPESEGRFAPLIEIHGVHYLDDGASGLPVGGLDYANLGSQPRKHFVAWGGIGARYEISRYELGATYEYAITDPKDDIFESRITIDFIVRW
ncbi:MAG: hypothetical protein KDE27_22955 [Planctomycetes bacterium]|nr:hypothetical protein [Planctomycetota bacterium]